MLLLLALTGASVGSEPDEELVAAALFRREAALEDARCPGGGDGLAVAASALRASVGGAPAVRAGAVYHAFTAMVHADARAHACRGEHPSAGSSGGGGVRYRELVSPRDILESDRRLRAWGDAEAAVAWRRLARESAGPRREPDADVCRCMGEAVRGRAVLYGYPTPQINLLTLLGEGVLGGCDPTAGGPILCPLGCWADRHRAGDELDPPTRVAWRADAGLLLGVAGEGAAVADWDRVTGKDPGLGALAGCLDDLYFGQAVRLDGAWAPAVGRASDRCLAAWAEQHVPSGQIDRAAVVRQD